MTLKGYSSLRRTRHKAKSWDRERRAVAGIEATKLGLDIRFVVTNLDIGSAEWIYGSLYCARGQAENGGARQTSLASRRRFCAVAVSRTSSLAPLIRNRKRDCRETSRSSSSTNFSAVR